MAVNLSPIWGAGAQLLDNSGNVLSGGKIYTYAAGTTTPATTYTSSNGVTANSNPIILNSAGRVPYEIWLTDGVSYKFVLKDSNDTLIATYDNLSGINSNFIAYTAQQEIQTATAGQTVFNLTTMQYQPGTNNLSVFVDGVNQYGPGAQYAFVETDSDTVTFVSGLHDGASVKFTTATPVASGATDAFNVSYTPPFVDSVATNVGDKLAQTVSVMDFGAVGDGVTDDYAAFQAAIDALPVGGGVIYIPQTDTNEWIISNTLNVRKKVHLIGQVSHGTGDQKGTQLIFPADTSGIVFNSYNTSLYTTVTPDPLLPGATGSVLENVMLLGDGGSTTADGVVVRCTMECRNVSVRNFQRYGFRIYADIGGGGSIEGDANSWILYDCEAILNGNHGVYVDGADANVGTAIKLHTQLNGGYGVYDNSLIGNTYIGLDTAGDSSGSIWCGNSSGTTTIIGAWEDGGGTSRLGAGVTSIGGNGGKPDGISTGFHMNNGIAKWAPYEYENSRTVVTVYSSLGKPDTTQTVYTFGSSIEGDKDAWKFKFDETQSRWWLQYANSTSFEPVTYINSGSDLYTNRGFTGPVFQNGYAVKNAGSHVPAAKVRMLGTAAPVSGTFTQGDIVYNSTPTSGGYIGWVCTTGGTPGTWKTFGLIS